MPSPEALAPNILAASLFSIPLLVLAVAVALLGLVQLSEAQRAEMRARIREALRLSDISLTKAAVWMRLDSASDLEKMLSGERKLDVWRLEMLPVECRRMIHFVSLRDLGLPELFRAAIKMAPAFADDKERSA